jgi:hypothetical protein
LSENIGKISVKENLISESECKYMKILCKETNVHPPKKSTTTTTKQKNYPKNTTTTKNIINRKLRKWMKLD